MWGKKVLGLSRLQECPNRSVNVPNRSAWTFYAPLVLKNMFQLHLSSEIGRFEVTIEAKSNVSDLDISILEVAQHFYFRKFDQFCYCLYQARSPSSVNVFPIGKKLRKATFSNIAFRDFFPNEKTFTELGD